jgi:RNA polymerase sigma factor (sigma-70 family)
MSEDATPIQAGLPAITQASVKVMESATEEIEEGDRAELLGAALSELTKRQRYVLEQHFLRGRTMRDLAAELGVTHQAIQQIEQKALRRLRLFSGLERKLAA